MTPHGVTIGAPLATIALPPWTTHVRENGVTVVNRASVQSVYSAAGKVQRGADGSHSGNDCPRGQSISAIVQMPAAIGMVGQPRVTRPAGQQQVQAHRPCILVTGRVDYVVQSARNPKTRVTSRSSSGSWNAIRAARQRSVKSAASVRGRLTRSHRKHTGSRP